MSEQGNLEAIEEIENVWIEMADGARIAARIWLPEGAPEKPVPAILEFIPYRKRDMMRERDESMHRYYAENGYACIRADVRGCGDSDGILDDEYTKREQADAVAIIEWIAAQPWCDGKVGMMGNSWGGFNTLQTAARNPPALKAVITLCASDDRYADDAHYMGGALLHENMQWGSLLTLYSAYPPDPEIVGEERWRDMWRERIKALRPMPAVWLEHQTRDEYWKHGSVCEDYSAIKCPVYAVSGWADGYSNFVPRLLENLDVPCKGLIGPWAHGFPQNGVPGPAIGFLQEALRWWDYHLKGIDNGIMDEPQYRVWMQDHVTPGTSFAERPGRWVAEKKWPGGRIDDLELPLPSGDVFINSPQSTGSESGPWCLMGLAGETPKDQRPDDARSLTFDTPPLTERMEILGAPEFEMEVEVDRPLALASARLCEVAPDGSSLRVTYGVLNLTHRDGHETPQPLQPGKPYKIKIKLNDCAHSFNEGNRIRLSLSPAYWPLVWPSPEAVTMHVKAGSAALRLPVRPPSPEDDLLAPFGPPLLAQAGKTAILKPETFRRESFRDPATGEAVYKYEGTGGDLAGDLVRFEDIGMEAGYHRADEYRIKDDDPLSARIVFNQTATLKRGDWDVRMELRTELTSTRTHFKISADLKTFENGKPFENRQWNVSIPRNMV